MIGNTLFLDPYPLLPPLFRPGSFPYLPTMLYRRQLPHHLRFRAPSYRKMDFPGVGGCPVL